jgi:hypothetical protein
MSDAVTIALLHQPNQHRGLSFGCEQRSSMSQETCFCARDRIIYSIDS